MNRSEEFKAKCEGVNKNGVKEITKKKDELSDDFIFLLNTLNQLLKVLKSLSTLDSSLFEEINSILVQSNTKIKSLDKAINNDNFFDKFFTHKNALKQHQLGKLISLNSLLVKVTKKFQSLSQKKHSTKPRGYDQLEEVDYKPPEAAAEASTSQLTPQQLQLLDNENNDLIQSNKQDILNLNKAQQSLIQITSLQSEIMTQLTQQSKMVDQLYDDSLTTTGSLTDASKQLLKANNNQSSSRKFLVVFFFMAGFSLLFLE
ncbi:hypothetical protein E3P99_01755 [Wallemia hederae]|uniref:t-SNARE coiled-coil homology domain-containing protein n=1 Tax=Wallemia hederae TaxID=1540922 RepID=A0A4T0FNC4_9BASI|nr:hypothetical protein E3P99_01755 [Wallemia hederae]